MSILSQNINAPSLIDYTDIFAKYRYFKNPDTRYEDVKQIINKIYPELLRFEPGRDYHCETQEEHMMANKIEHLIDPLLCMRGHLMAIFRCIEHSDKKLYMFRLVDHIVNLSIVDVEFFA